MKKLIFSLFILSGCSYHMGRESSFEDFSVNVPYVTGDEEGFLTKSLIDEITSSGKIKYKNNGFDYVLKVAIQSMEETQIDYIHDREPSGRAKKNIMPTGNQINLKALVSLISAKTNKEIIKPQLIKASIDYDYVKQDSIQDLSFILNGVRRTVLDFSLGQLETKGAAQKAAKKAIYRKLSKKIVNFFSESPFIFRESLEENY
jgi:hypothetical protein